MYQKCATFRGMHNVFHVSLLCSWLSNNVHADKPPIKIDGKAEYKVAEIKGHHEQQSEMQYVTLLITLNSLEDVWLSIA